MASIDTRNPVNFGHPLNRGKVAWFKAVPWLSGGPDWPDLCSGLRAPFRNSAAGVGWGGPPPPGGFGSIRTGGSFLVDALATLPTSWFTASGYTVAGWGRLTTVSGTAVLFGGGNALVDLATNNGFPYYQAPFGSVFSSIITTDGNWHWYAIVQTATDGTIYVDGADGGSNANQRSVNAFAATPFSLGGSPSGGDNWPGYIDDFEIWSRPLSDGEILARYREHLTGSRDLFNRRRSRVAAAPVARFRPFFDDDDD